MSTFVPRWIAGVTGFVLLLAWFVPAITGWQDTALRWFNILAAVAFVLGGLNIVITNVAGVRAREPGWGYKAVTLVAFVVTLACGLGKLGVRPSTTFPDAAYSGAYLQDGSPLWWQFEYVLTPLISTMFSLLAFFVASAAFRAFRAKGVDSVVLLGTALVVMAGQSVLGGWLTGWLPEDGPLSVLRLEKLREAVLTVPMAGGMRAITIGVALGVVATSLKVLLGIDRSAYGGR